MGNTNALVGKMLNLRLIGVVPLQQGLRRLHVEVALHVVPLESFHYNKD